MPITYNPTVRTVAEADKALREQRAHNKKRLEALRAKIEKAESAGHPTFALAAELETLKQQIETGEAILEKSLKAAQEHEAEQEQARDKAAKLRRADLEATQKAKALDAWIDYGGDPALFEKSWPTIRENLLTEAVAKKVNETPVDREPLVKSL